MDLPSTSIPRFSPVVQTPLVPCPSPIGISTDYSGMDIVIKSAARAAHSAVIGLGGAQNIHPATLSNMSSTVSRLLEARNIAEQLKQAGVWTKFTSILTTTELILLEPIVRAYGYYGGFTLLGKRYTARALQDRLAAALIKLCAQVHYDQLNNENKVGMTAADFAQIDLDRYTIGDSGEVTYRDQSTSLRDRILDVVDSVSQAEDVDKDVRISLIRSATDISDELGYLHFLSALRGKRVQLASTTRTQDELTAEHKAKAEILFNQTIFTDQAVISSRLLISRITVAFSICRHLTSLLSLRMKACRFQPYKGGTAAQLATLENGVLYSEVPLSEEDITMSVACSMSAGTAMRFRCCPAEDRDNLIRQLVMQSMI